MARLVVTIRLAWWVRWYISGVALCSLLTGLEPDMEKIKAKVMKGIKVTGP